MTDLAATYGGFLIGLVVGGMIVGLCRHLAAGPWRTKGWRPDPVDRAAPRCRVRIIEDRNEFTEHWGKA